MSQEPGDRKFGHGDQITRKNSTGSEISEGHWVVPNGDETIAPSDVSGAGGSLAGVTSDDHGDGEYGRVHVRGVVIARVADGVTAGSELAAPDSGSGTAGVAEAGGSSGIFALEDAWQGDDGNYYAKCLIR